MNLIMQPALIFTIDSLSLGPQLDAPAALTAECRAQKSVYQCVLERKSCERVLISITALSLSLFLLFLWNFYRQLSVLTQLLLLFVYMQKRAKRIK